MADSGRSMTRTPSGWSMGSSVRGDGGATSRMTGTPPIEPACAGASAGSSEIEIKLLNPLPRRDLERGALVGSDMVGTPFPARRPRGNPGAVGIVFHVEH